MNAAGYNFFTDFFKNISEVGAFDPSKYNNTFDFDAALSKNKRHVDTSASAQHLMMSNMQAILKRQAEVLQENATNLMSCCKKASTINSPEKALEEQSNFIKDSMARNLANIRELTEMATKAQMEVLDFMSHTISENLSENCKTAKPAKGDK